MTRKVTLSDAEQGSQEWHNLRCGILTASLVKHIITPKKKEVSATFHETIFFKKKVLERVTGIIIDHIDDEGAYQSEAMIEGASDEDWAIKNYSEHYDEDVSRTGFIHLSDENYQIGFSPDGICENYFIECKSRAPHLHIQTVLTSKVPDEFMAQIQTGLLVTGFEYAKYVSWPRVSESFSEHFSLPAMCIRVERDEEYIANIEKAAIAFEEKIKEESQRLLQILANRRENFFPAKKEYVSEILGSEVLS
jgi:hypothetical protein